MTGASGPSSIEGVRTFAELIDYLRDELDWPIASDDLEELTFEYSPEELGLDATVAAKIQSIKRLRPLVASQPWGIFFVEFEPKQLPVVALRRILSRVVTKKKASANSVDRAAWDADDLLFVSNFGSSTDREISFAHFSSGISRTSQPVLRVLGWDSRDTRLYLSHVAETLQTHLEWPADESDIDAWRVQWRGAFTLGYREVVTTSRTLAIRLAALASQIRTRISAALEIETSEGALTTLMNTFREALVHDLDADGFADMYAQTISYGLLSARIADPDSATVDDFAGHMRTNPFLRELMDSFLNVDSTQGGQAGVAIDFDELGVNDVVDLLDGTNMTAVLRDFGNRNPREDPVIHFYELFLAEYDQQRRMQRGVFYTPRPVVGYIVEKVDTQLRVKFGLVDGLADCSTWGEVHDRNPELQIPAGVDLDERFVTVLDPAVGTGTFIVEAIDLIYRTLVRRWRAEQLTSDEIRAKWNEYVPNELLPRLHGYELMMAPYAIAHLKIGLKLHETGYDFGGDERARIYLTNALEPAHDFSGHLAFAIPALAHEAIAVNRVKVNTKFTAVIGNPPYSQMSQNLGEEERALVQAYKEINGVRLVERGAIALERNLQDDYVKFIRFAEIAIETTGCGVVGMITNHAYLTNPTLRGMRWHLLQTFDEVAILDLHGSTKIKESPPAGIKDKNVFDIQQGVAIGIFSTAGNATAKYEHADLWGDREAKYEALANAGTLITNSFSELDPAPESYLFVPRDEELHAEYSRWEKLSSIFPLYGSAITTARDGLVIGFSDDEVTNRVAILQDDALSDEQVLETLKLKESAIWKIEKARASLNHVHLKMEMVDVDYRPFDRRRLFYNDAVVSSPRHPTMDNLARPGSLALAVSRQQGAPGFRHIFVSEIRFDEGLVSNRSREKTVCFPLYVYGNSGQLLVDDRAENINPAYLTDLRDRYGPDVDIRKFAAYIYAICASPSYRARFESLLKEDFPRIPLAKTPKLFNDLTDFGESLIHTHLQFRTADIPEETTFFGAIESPVERVVWSDGTVWLDATGTAPEVVGSFGFHGVSEAVWNFEIGAYKVCEKWLKDRKGRCLSLSDSDDFRRVVHAISKTILLATAIDEAIEGAGSWPEAFA